MFTVGLNYTVYVGTNARWIPTWIAVIRSPRIMTRLYCSYSNPPRIRNILTTELDERFMTPFIPVSVCRTLGERRRQRWQGSYQRGITFSAISDSEVTSHLVCMACSALSRRKRERLYGRFRKGKVGGRSPQKWTR